ncbi:plasmid partitioning protein RepB [Antarcticimicrobium sediminis]|uniref:Plasmid partitioning protein RepB n=1 Tax=Antarcticimicrobium sediminis TaxID=2546227 RepID=A0A4V2Z705_9RHOB|nr:plasmid partitioning protein RepB [Antarcticimicrobium sediminis]TDE34666.1 plasmid partitioning protein RepB [Antarcticimicrobium sediminis]
MARKGILSNDTAPGKPRPEVAERAPMMPRGAVGALQSSLSKLQENAVQEIDVALIDDAGFEDRLGQDSQAFTQLKDSLATYGQQVPVLLRPHSSKPGRFEIVYGRRRMKALRELGLPVKAMVRQLDDHALVMAQGQENTSRQDLSFIEKASFAAQLQEADYDRPTIAAALSIDLPMLSRMLTVGTAFDLPFLRQIGSAPGIGRDRWLSLAKLFQDPAAKSRAAAFMNGPDFAALNSDARFEAVFERAARKPDTKAKPPAPAKPRTLRSPDGKALADIRATSRGVTLSIPARTADGFDLWLNDNAEAVINDLHARWKTERTED